LGPNWYDRPLSLSMVQLQLRSHDKPQRRRGNYKKKNPPGARQQSEDSDLVHVLPFCMCSCKSEFTVKNSAAAGRPGDGVLVAPEPSSSAVRSKITEQAC
jgi:hypothetical protein